MMMRNKWVLAAVAMALAVGAVVLALPRGGDDHAVALRSAAPRAGALPVIFDAPDFTLPDQNNVPVSRDSLRGKVWVVDFIFTNCAHTCPRVTARRGELQQRITDPRVTFVSVTVDPERDTAAARKAYGEKNRVDESRWHFVSPPDRDAAMRLARAMKVAGPPREHDNPVLHADRFILVDARGKARGTYHIDDPAAMDRLVTEANALAGAAAGAPAR